MFRTLIKRTLIKTKIFSILRDWELILNALLKKVHEEDYFLLSKNIDGGEIADIGANLGQSVISFKRLFPKSSIVCFEPNPSCLKTLNKVSKMFGGSVVVENSGLLDETNSLYFYVPVIEKTELLQEGSFDKSVFNRQEVISRIGRNFQLSTYKVRVFKLDDLGKSFSLIKIDVQGLEFQVLKGAANTIKKSLPVVMVEKDSLNNERIKVLMQGFGYTEKSGLNNIIWVHPNSKYA